MKHLFIINPIAGKGKSLELIPMIKEIFSFRKEEYHIEITTHPGHATEIAKRYVESDDYRVYSVGGDGTLNEVLNGVVGSNSSLAAIPSGSGNDFVKSICNNLSREGILEKSITGKEKLIDVGSVNGKYFINISSVGFDGDVVYHTRKFKKVPGINGSVAYILGVAATLLKYDSYPVNIVMDGNKLTTDALLLAAGNGKYYGGGMMPVPKAELDDGLLDILLVEKVSRAKIIRFFAKFVKGQHASVKEAHFYRCKGLSMKCTKDIVLNIDGELEKVCEASFSIIPGGIKIVIPK